MEQHYSPQLLLAGHEGFRLSRVSRSPSGQQQQREQRLGGETDSDTEMSGLGLSLAGDTQMESDPSAVSQSRRTRRSTAGSTGDDGGDGTESERKSGPGQSPDAALVVSVMSALLRGLSDRSAAVRNRCFAFWDREKFLPVRKEALLDLLDGNCSFISAWWDMFLLL